LGQLLWYNVNRKKEKNKKKKRKRERKMNLADTYNTTARPTISCRDSHNCESNHHSAKGCGHYEQKAYNPTVKVICEVNGVTLRPVQSIDTKFEILFDGVLANRYPSLKVATQFFIDLAGITPTKFKKLAMA
jgi:hypothetical protein